MSKIVFYIVPNLSAIDVRGAVVGEGAINHASIAAWSAYLAAYLIVALFAATWIFARKEF
jgi:hypothetical protein